MAEASSSDEPNIDPHWFCLRSQTKREHIAGKLLENQVGLEVFCPRVSKIKRTKTGKRRFLEALFPGYMFARFSLAEHYRRVIHTKGVRYLVSQGPGHAPVADAVIHDLRASIPDTGVLEEHDPSIEPGAHVEVVDGGLGGLDGKVLASLDANNRIQVLLDFLGREVTVRLSPDQVRLARQSP